MCLVTMCLFVLMKKIGKTEDGLSSLLAKIFFKLFVFFQLMDNSCVSFHDAPCGAGF